jgi:hypothetical protein
MVKKKEYKPETDVYKYVEGYVDKYVGQDVYIIRYDHKQGSRYRLERRYCNTFNVHSDGRVTHGLDGTDNFYNGRLYLDYTEACEVLAVANDWVDK